MKLQYGETLSNFAFNFNLRRYNTVNMAKQNGGGTKQLLQSITSAARPNRMLALMVGFRV